MSDFSLLTAAEVLLLYPGGSLRSQIRRWASKPIWRRVETSEGRSPSGIRGLLRRADVAVIDATDDSPRAADAFLQAVAQLGAAGVAVYTEQIHDGLEAFVRVRGSLFLFGPLCEEQWEGLFARMVTPRDGSALAEIDVRRSFARSMRGAILFTQER